MFSAHQPHSQPETARLYRAIETGNLQDVRAWLDLALANADTPSHTRGPGHTDQLSDPKTGLWAQNSDGHNALHVAVLNAEKPQAAAIAELLLRTEPALKQALHTEIAHGLNHTQDDTGLTPLQLALYHRRLPRELIFTMLHFDAQLDDEFRFDAPLIELDLKDAPHDRRSPLQKSTLLEHIANAGSYEAMYFAKKYGVSVAAPQLAQQFLNDSLEDSPRAQAAGPAGGPLSHQPPAADLSRCRSNALHEHVAKHKDHDVKFLLSLGTEIEDRTWRLAIECTQATDRLAQTLAQVTFELLEQHAKTLTNRALPRQLSQQAVMCLIEYALDQEKYAEVLYWCKNQPHFDINARHPQTHWSLLYKATFKKDVRAVSTLLECNAHVDKGVNFGLSPQSSTPCRLAFEGLGQSDANNAIFKLMVQHPSFADALEKNSQEFKWTALHQAIAARSAREVLQLIKQGENPDAKAKFCPNRSDEGISFDARALAQKLAQNASNHTDLTIGLLLRNAQSRRPRQFALKPGKKSSGAQAPSPPSQGTRQPVSIGCQSGSHMCLIS